MTGKIAMQAEVRLTTESSKGFYHESTMPNPLIFSQSKRILSAICGIKITKRGTLFNRRSTWLERTVVLHPKSGTLFVYMSDKKGFALRICTAHIVTMSVVKNKASHPKAHDSHAVMLIKFTFGDLLLQLPVADRQKWYESLLDAHQVGQPVSSIGGSERTPTDRKTARQLTIRRRSKRLQSNATPSAISLFEFNMSKTDPAVSMCTDLALLSTALVPRKMVSAPTTTAQMSLMPALTAMVRFPEEAPVPIVTMPDDEDTNDSVLGSHDDIYRNPDERIFRRRKLRSE